MDVGRKRVRCHRLASSERQGRWSCGPAALAVKAEQIITSEKSRFLSFCAGQCTRSVLWSSVDLLIGYHLIVRAGFPGPVVGAILLGTVVISALPDVFIAHHLSSRGQPASLALRMQLLFGVLALSFAVLLFGPTPATFRPALIYVCATSLAFRFAYAVYDVSQNALISLLPDDFAGVRRFVTGKTVMAAAGRLIASCMAFVALGRPDDPWADLVVLGVAAVPLAASAAWLSRARLSPQRLPAERSAVRVNWRTLPYRRLAAPLAAVLCQAGPLGLTWRLLPLAGAATDSHAAGGSLVLAMVLGTVGGPLIAHVFPASRRAGPWRPSALFCLAGVAAGVAVLLPVGRTLSLVASVVYGAGSAALANLIWERTARIVTEHKATTGEPIDAPAFALLTTAIKLAMAVCAGLFGVLVDGIRHDDPASRLVAAVVLAAGGLGTWIALEAGAPAMRQRRR